MLRSKVVNLPRGPAQSVTSGPGRALERRQRAPARHRRARRAARPHQPSIRRGVRCP